VSPVADQLAAPFRLRRVRARWWLRGVGPLVAALAIVACGGGAGARAGVPAQIVVTGCGHGAQGVYATGSLTNTDRAHAHVFLVTVNFIEPQSGTYLGDGVRDFIVLAGKTMPWEIDNDGVLSSIRCQIASVKLDPMIPVPSVVGEPLSQAKHDLQVLGLRTSLGIGPSAADSLVTDQYPAGGAPVRSGTVITVDTRPA
jgi:PASTA domain